MVVPKGSRLIDRVNTVRTRPMKVLVLGMSRTGTSSLRDALIRLGLRPFHFRELMIDYKRFIPLWTEALEAKYFSKSVPYGREEFDKLLGDFDAVEDNPCVMFVDELTKAYPEAKVILTNRSVDSWVPSMQRTVFAVRQSKLYQLFYWLHPISRSWFPFSTLISTIWYNNEYDGVRARQVFLDHYEHVRQVVPKENLLEFHFGDGFEKLCTFLDIPIPDEPYPHSNDSAIFQARHTFAKKELVLTFLRITLTLVIAAGAVVVSRYLYAQEPSLFWMYAGLMALMAAAAFCFMSAFNGSADVENLLYRIIETKAKEKQQTKEMKEKAAEKRDHLITDIIQKIPM